MADDSSGRGGVAVTPHDTNRLNPPRAIYVGVGGDITCRFQGANADVVLKNAPSGAEFAYRLEYVRATGTTATNLVAIY